MKTKNFLMSILLVMGSIAAKAAGYPPELALVSQPVMVYNYNSVTVYYDVENIGDYTYRGYVYLYLDPDDGYSYADKYVKVRPGQIKRIALELPSYWVDPYFAYTIMPYYSLGHELYSFTTFEYFDPLYFYWHGPRTAHWIVRTVPPRLRHYHRPGVYRYYYDGYRPPMPPPHGASATPPPMDPSHHTYNYHHSNGGYPAHNEWNDGSTKPNASSATVRPNTSSAGSMSSGSYNNSSSDNSGSSGGAINSPAPSTRPKTNSGRTGNTGSNTGRVNRSSDISRPSGTSNSGRTGNSSSSRVNNSSNSNRTSSSSSSSRVNSSSGTSRSSGTSSPTSRSNSSSSSKSTSSSNSRSGASSGRR